MGEDAIIGCGLSQHGKLIYHDKLFFLHNDLKNITYSVDKNAYARRVSFSRLFLSLEKQRLDGGSKAIARIHYHYYSFWRITGYFLNYLLSSSAQRRAMLHGTFTSWCRTFRHRFIDSQSARDFWHNEAEQDITIHGLN